MHAQASIALEQPPEAPPPKYLWKGVLSVAEVLPASFCSVILWQYARELQGPLEFDPKHDHEQPGTGPVLSSLFPHPAPRLVLISALGFGCCVSSFAYRRKEKDPLQVAVFVLLIGAVATVAYGVGATSNMILLGYMPFSTCVAMVFSICGHSIFRWVRSEKGYSEDSEKLQLL